MQIFKNKFLSSIKDALERQCKGRENTRISMFRIQVKLKKTITTAKKIE